MKWKLQLSSNPRPSGPASPGRSQDPKAPLFTVRTDAFHLSGFQGLSIPGGFHLCHWNSWSSCDSLGTLFHEQGKVLDWSMVQMKPIPKSFIHGQSFNCCLNYL